MVFFLAVSAGRSLGYRYIVLADMLLAATVGALLVALLGTDLRVRKPPPEPEIRLNFKSDQSVPAVKQPGA